MKSYQANEPMETKDTTQSKEARKGTEKKPALLSQELRLGKNEGYRVDQERGSEQKLEIEWGNAEGGQ